MLASNVVSNMFSTNYSFNHGLCAAVNNLCLTLTYNDYVSDMQFGILFYINTMVNSIPYVGIKSTSLCLVLISWSSMAHLTAFGSS